jgi:L-asparaginase
MNLRDAIRFACFGSKGIHIVFNGKAILGTRGRKIKTKSYDAFASINYPYAAYIDGSRITKYVREDNEKKDVYFYDDIYPNVFLLKLAPGMKPDVIDYISDEYDAIVIESYGSGGIPFNDKRNFLDKLAKAAEKGKIIVIATQVMHEGSDAGVYKVGKLAMNYPILQAYDMTVEASITKLMWILAQTRKFEEVKELFYKNIHEDILYTLD